VKNGAVYKVLKRHIPLKESSCASVSACIRKYSCGVTRTLHQVSKHRSCIAREAVITKNVELINALNWAF